MIIYFDMDGVLTNFKIGIYFDGYTQSSEDLIGELIPELSMS